jgi:hypothetical protein
VARLVPYLPAELLGTAYTIVTTSAQDHLWELRTFASQVPGEHGTAIATTALDTAKTITRGAYLASDVAPLAGYLPPEQRAQAIAQAFEMAAQMTRRLDRHLAWMSLAPWLPDHLLNQALTEATTIDDPYEQAWMISILARGVPSEARERIFGNAVHVVATDSGWPRFHSRGALLANLAPHLSAPLLDRAVHVALTLTNPSDRATALTALAPHLSEGERTPCLLSALEAAVSDNYQRRTLRALIPLLPDALIHHTLDAVSTSEDPYSLTLVTATLASRLTDDERLKALAKAMSVARSATDPGTRASLLLTLAPHLAEAQQHDLLSQLREAIRNIHQPHHRALLTARLARQLPRGDREETGTQALEIAAQGGRTAVMQTLGIIIAGGLPNNTTTASVAAVLRVRRWWP